jgi:hypothetical protein
MFCFNSVYLQVVRQIIILCQSLGAGGNNNWTEFSGSFFSTGPSKKFVYLVFKNVVHNSYKHTSPNTKKTNLMLFGEMFLYIITPINAFYLTKNTLLLHYKLKSVNNVLEK